MYSFDGILVFGLLFICTCAYFKKVPRLNNWLLSEKKGVWGIFYKGISASNRTDIVTNQDIISTLLMWWFAQFHFSFLLANLEINERSIEIIASRQQCSDSKPFCVSAVFHHYNKRVEHEKISCVWFCFVLYSVL